MSTAAAFASVDDLEAGWRVLTDEESVRASVLLDRASRMVRRRWSDIDDRISSGRLEPEDVGDIICAMVKSAMLGPEIPIESESSTTGPFQVNRKFANPTGDLYFAKWMVDALTPPRPRSFTGWLG